MSARAGKEQRCIEANRVIEAIAKVGRRFFWSEQFHRVSRFEIDARGRIWLIDNYSNKRIFTGHKGRWRHFTEGGTLRRLIEALHAYIRDGKTISRRHFGPWPQYICGGDLWGYGDSMEVLRQELFASRVVDAASRPFPDHADLPRDLPVRNLAMREQL